MLIWKMGYLRLSSRRRVIFSCRFKPLNVDFWLYGALSYQNFASLENKHEILWTTKTDLIRDPWCLIPQNLSLEITSIFPRLYKSYTILNTIFRMISSVFTNFDNFLSVNVPFLLLIVSSNRLSYCYPYYYEQRYGQRFIFSKIKIIALVNLFPFSSKQLWNSKCSKKAARSNFQK